MGKEKKGINPMDSFRKQQKKKDSKRAKETRDSAREIRDLLNDPSKIDQEIQKVQKQSDENKLDKGLKDRIIELKRMKEVALQKQRIDAAQGKRVNKPEASNQSSTYGSQAVAQRAPGNAQYVQAQQQYGGYGVPPGYAQPHGAAYPGGVLPQQYYGYSHPGGMMPVAMGGVNGIPLPPPRPPVAAAPGPPSSGAASAQRERKKRQDADFVDPLDPMASNYTERYGRKPERSSETVAQSHSQVPPPQRAAQNPPIPSFPQTANGGNRDEEEDDDHDGEYDEETQRRLLQLTASYRQQEQHDAGENEIGPALPPNGHKRSRESDDGEEDNDEHAQKRGKTKKASEDTMVLPGMEFYADDDDDDDDDDDEDDDSSDNDDADDAEHQNRGGLAQKDDVSDEEDDDDASAAVGPSMPQGFDSYQYDYSSYSAFPALMDPEEYLRQMQQQNEAGNNEGQPQPQPTAVSSSSSSSAPRRDVWVEDGDDDDGGDIPPSQAFTAPEHPEPTPSDVSLFPTGASTAAPSTLSTAPTTAPTSSSSATAAVHKADASLTAFLPSVLKKKVPAKKPGLVPRPPPSLPPPAAAAAVAPTSAAPVAEADDEYLRFMAEINELG